MPTGQHLHPPLVDILKKLGRHGRDLLERGRAEAAHLLDGGGPARTEEDTLVAYETAYWDHPMHRVIRRVGELSGLEKQDVERVAFVLIEKLGKELEPYADAL